jgi:hypothetical protein
LRIHSWHPHGAPNGSNGWTHSLEAGESHCVYQLLSGTYTGLLNLVNSSNIFQGIFIGNGAGLKHVPVSAGSSNYIQHGTSTQTGASFNIDGNGTVGGTLNGSTAVNTSGSYQIGGGTVWS